VISWKATQRICWQKRLPYTTGAKRRKYEYYYYGEVWRSIKEYEALLN
jgi:hypothetical protein